MYGVGVYLDDNKEAKCWKRFEIYTLGQLTLRLTNSPINGVNIDIYAPRIVGPMWNRVTDEGRRHGLCSFVLLSR